MLAHRDHDTAAVGDEGLNKHPENIIHKAKGKENTSNLQAGHLHWWQWREASTLADGRAKHQTLMLGSLNCRRIRSSKLTPIVSWRIQAQPLLLKVTHKPVTAAAHAAARAA